MECFSCLLLIIIVLFCMFDVTYYVRIIATILFGRLFQKKYKVTDKVTLYGFCSTQDLDLVFKHMNNARFVRDLDFVRFHFYDRTGLYQEMVKRKSDALQAATNIRYRRVIPIFTFYRIETEMIYWEDRSFYLEHKFLTSDNFVRAIVLSKATMRGDVSANDIMKSLGVTEKPTSLSKDLEYWIKSMEASSEKLKVLKEGKKDS